MPEVPGPRPEPRAGNISQVRIDTSSPEQTEAGGAGCGGGERGPARVWRGLGQEGEPGGGAGGSPARGEGGGGAGAGDGGRGGREGPAPWLGRGPFPPARGPYKCPPAGIP